MENILAIKKKKKEILTDIYYTMDKFQKHYAWWKELETTYHMIPSIWNVQKRQITETENRPVAS